MAQRLISKDRFPDEADYEVMDVEAMCMECEKLIPWNSWLIHAWGKHSVICDPCHEANEEAYRASKREEKPDKVQVAREKAIPPLYHDTVAEKLPHRQLQQILGWEYTPAVTNTFGYSKPVKGIYAVGPTRAGKTRSMCLLVEKLIGKGINVKCLFAGELQTQMMEVMRSDRGYADWKRKLINADVLFLDDLFNERVTPRTESTWFEVIDGRMSHRRPTLITSQYLARDAVKLFSEPRRGHAFLARLKESSNVVAFQEALQVNLDL
mgnify:CR=1 FL=1